MMINVDAEFARADRRDRCAQPSLNCSIERDDHIDILRRGRRFGEHHGAGKKTIFCEHAFLIPNPDIFAERLERKSERKLTPEGVAVGTNVTQNRKTRSEEHTSELQSHSFIS